MHFEYLLKVHTGEFGMIDLGFSRGGNRLWIGQTETRYRNIDWILKEVGITEDESQRPDIHAEVTIELSPAKLVRVGPHTRTLGELAEELYLTSLEKGSVLRLKKPTDRFANWAKTVSLAAICSLAMVGILAGAGAPITVNYLQGWSLNKDQTETLKKYAIATHDNLKRSEVPKGQRRGYNA